LATAAPRALKGYFLMSEWALAENLLEAKYEELMLCTVKAAEFQLGSSMSTRVERLALVPPRTNWLRL